MAGSSGDGVPLRAVIYMIHHIFLPPKLPQEDDSDLEHETVLLETVSNALRDFEALAGHGSQRTARSVSDLMKVFVMVRDRQGNIDQTSLQDALRDLSATGGAIPLHIRAQNAGLIISKVNTDIYFEAFELSPLNEAIVATKGRLRRSFPGSAFAVTQKVFDEDGFQATFANTVATMSHQKAPDMKPKVKKAKQMHDEERDTTHPKLVTEHLMSFVRAAGRRASHTTIWKNTRDEVLWLDSLLPWRRSPTWLLARVAMQLVFSRSAENEKPPADLYKTFMAFLLAYILKIARKWAHVLGNDTLLAMNAKLSRRLLKIGNEPTNPWLAVIQQVMTETHDVMEEQWQRTIACANKNLDMLRLQSLDRKNATFIDIPELDDFILKMSKRDICTDRCDFVPSSQFRQYPPEELPNIDGSVSGSYQSFALAAFESWVNLYLVAWLDNHMDDVMTCGRLRTLLEDYYRCAASHYVNNPEGNSIMIMTVIELWTACDKSACAIHNLLLDYDPRVPVNLLRSLILPSKGQLEKLAVIEDYLTQRRHKAKDSCTPILRSFGQPDDFSVRYFDSSREHQSLLSKINDRAESDREEKRKEFRQKKRQYEDLMLVHRQCVCEFIIDVVDDEEETRHNPSCKKCRSLAEAKSINIQIHEWPLPDNKLRAKSIVFEFMVPTAFSEWRDATIFLFINVLKYEYSRKESPRATYDLKSDQGLSPHTIGSKTSNQRIGVLSEDKPHTATHRSKKIVEGLRESDVCLANGLQYRYYDFREETFAGELNTTNGVLELCTYSLSERAASLQKFLIRGPSVPNGLKPNEVIACQSECPDHFSNDEYRAFGALPLGGKIQWMNILTQLRAPMLDFNKIETNLLLLQTICQAGPASQDKIRRANHEILDDEKFGLVFLAELRESLQRVEGNWKSLRALSSFVHLGVRLLSLASSLKVHTECLEFLTWAREVSFNWVGVLRDKAQQCADESQRNETLSTAFEVALICANTFDVDQQHLEDIIACPTKASLLIQCCISIQECSRSGLENQNRLQSIMFKRWEKLSYRALPGLTKQVVEMKSTYLDDAIKRAWSDYKPGNAWKSLSVPYEHWLVNETELDHNSSSLPVHYNLLTAELLVNGLPLTRLPSHYESHPMYDTLFNRLTLEVMPTRMPGMSFSAKKAFEGQTIHFGMQSAPGESNSSSYDLLVQAAREGQKYDLLPRRLFRDGFPVKFVVEFVHWYDHADGTIEFRPVQHAWSSSSETWRLKREGLSWRLIKNDITLVSTKSETAAVLAEILSPVEMPPYIHITYDGSSGLIDIDLPGLQTGFFLEPEASLIRSRQFRGLSIDSDQKIGTLIGLQNKLVLKHDKESNDRVVMIPESTVTFKKTFDHSVVSIARSSPDRIHIYHLDERLGRVLDNGNMQSKLFLCYLHGVTSHCLPDPFIRRTGTEQALSILNSAAVRSFDYLRQENIDMLEQIAKLSPARKHYPVHERVMQTVSWNPNLSFMSQHSSFYTSVETIFKQAADGQLFYPDLYIKVPVLEFAVPHLLERDLIRSSAFRVSNSGAEHYTIHHDVEYSSRDRGQNSVRASQAFVAASLIFQSRGLLHTAPGPNLRETLWNFLALRKTIPGPDMPLEQRDLKYDFAWLVDSPMNIGRLWCKVHHFFRQTPHQRSRFEIMMWFATIAFAVDAEMQVVYTLVAFYDMQDIAGIDLPPVSSFNLSQGRSPDSSVLYKLISSAKSPFHSSPESRLPKQGWETKRHYRQRRECLFEQNQHESIRLFASRIASQWPCKAPETPMGDDFDKYIIIPSAMQRVSPIFQEWYDNHCFYGYLGLIEDALSCKMVESISPSSYAISVSPLRLIDRKRFVTLDEIVGNDAPSTLPEGSDSLGALKMTECTETHAGIRLHSLLSSLKNRLCTKSELDYIKDLAESVSSLRGRIKKSIMNAQALGIRGLMTLNLKDCNRRVRDSYSAIIHHVHNQIRGLHGGAVTPHQLPRLCPVVLLEQLTHARWQLLSEGWKKCIVNYALALTELQRAERLLDLAGNPVDFNDEFFNMGHRNWNPSDFPEILLLEVESGIMIREVQQDIAQQMRNPPAGRNAVMQLNMGEGKSSVIVPIVVLTEADGTRLLRVIVAKPQSKQMFQMLLSKLGCLLGRRIYHMPFSRALKIDYQQAVAIGKMYAECMENRGILLVQPENLLSFQLLCVESHITGREVLGGSLLSTQYFFNTKSRDIVDESDENFSVKFELIFTMGMQTSIEFSPERWSTIQAILGLVARFAPEVKRSLPQSILIDDRWAGRVPIIRILRSDAQDMLLKRVAAHICNIGITGFPVNRQSEEVRRAVLIYISKAELTTEEIAAVESGGKESLWTDSIRNYLLLVRGLIAGGVLSFTFGSKRWRVNYGLDSNRQPKTKLAVPFRAKDNPTPRSEFSHPDVVIVLTSLSYYYGGLKDDDLFLAFDHLTKSDQAQSEYGEWVRTASNLPKTFRQIIGINIKDTFQCVNHVFPRLRYSKGAIDYFLSHIVFPKEMKEFPYKISASGWDIGREKSHPTTGFSGTNDSRHVLPLSVNHLDLPKQKHTNALVLEYLLQDENSVQILPRTEQATTSDADLLLSTIEKMNPTVQVILDVGAQILEPTNREMAMAWLEKRTDHKQAKAVVFFNDSDELSVLDRSGRSELLQTSAFAKQLDVCLVFLDEAHTRGTDLKLPNHYRAAVTLGAGLTKDRLVQACMRMRKLGKGQSIVFCVPEEVGTKILERVCKTSGAEIEVADVLSWAISETCTDIRRSMPLWAAQGRRFETQRILWDAARRENRLVLTKDKAEQFQEKEAQTLDDRYRPRGSSENLKRLGWDVENVNISRIIERCKEFDSANFATATLQEEQERELAPEIEQECEVQRSAPAKALQHNLHEDVKSFVRTGELVARSEAFLPAFKSLRSSSAAAYIEVSQFPRDLLVTADFARTVEISGQGSVSDAYQRPVQWILTSSGAEQNSNTVRHMVIISPFEAQELLSEIRLYKKVTLHLYAPRSSLEFHPLDSLDLFVQGKPFDPSLSVVPRRLIVLLNLFAGQLYLNSYKEYIEVCDLLGLAWKPPESGMVVGADGFIIASSQAVAASSSRAAGFRTSPVKFLKVLLGQIRRHGEGIDKTHMGKILAGAVLEEEVFRGADFEVQGS